MTKIKFPSFGRPGRPRPIELSDLFLWSPRLEMELLEISCSEENIEKIGFDQPDSFIRLIRDLGRKGRKISLDRVKIFTDSFKKIDNFHPLADELIKAIDGKESEIDNSGTWQAFIGGVLTNKDGQFSKISLLAQHIIDIENALKEPTQAWRQGDMNRCANLLEESSLLQNYVWSDAIKKLRDATTQEEIIIIRGMVMLELYLSYLACCDAQLKVDGFASKSMFDGLFPDFSADEIQHPVALFFKWLESYSENSEKKVVDCIQQPSKKAADRDDGSVKSQFRRWKRKGKIPFFDTRYALFTKLYADKAEHGKKEIYLSECMAMVTKRIQFLMPILKPISKCNPEEQQKHLPFQCASVQKWRERRYQHWYQYWRALLEKES